MNSKLGNSLAPSCASSAQAFALSADDLQDLCNTPSIDLRLLMETCMGKAAFAVSLLEEFASSATDRQKEFGEQLKQGNLRTIAEMAHGLRGAAQILGATTLGNITIEVEAACCDGDVALTHLRVRQLCRELQLIQRHIPGLCPKLRSQLAADA